MISLLNMSKVDRLLCLGAHADDIEIGAGGTILRLVEQNPGIQVRWVVLTGAASEREQEARKSAALFTSGAGGCDVDVHDFKDAFLPWQGEQVKDVFEALKGDFSPDLIVTHYGGDRHQDHRIVSELTWNTWRDHAILEYEVLKWDGDLGQPSIYVPLEESVCRQKVDHILATFKSQQSRTWFDEETFRLLLRVRGVECNARYAEAFYARKLVW